MKSQGRVPDFSALYCIFFVQNEPRLTVPMYSSRLGSSCLHSFSALCQADDKFVISFSLSKKPCLALSETRLLS